MSELCVGVTTARPMPAPDRPSFRPTLETLEDRLSPGSLGNVFGLLHRPAGDDALFQAASAYSAQAAGAGHGNPNHGVLPIDSSAFGRTYAVFSAVHLTRRNSSIRPRRTTIPSAPSSAALSWGFAP